MCSSCSRVLSVGVMIIRIAVLLIAALLMSSLTALWCSRQAAAAVAEAEQRQRAVAHRAVADAVAPVIQAVNAMQNDRSSVEKKLRDLGQRADEQLLALERRLQEADHSTAGTLRQVAASLQQLNATVAALRTLGGRHDAARPAEASPALPDSEVARQLRLLEFVVNRMFTVYAQLNEAAKAEVEPANGGRPRPPKLPLKLLPRVADCDFDCSGHGMSLDARGVTNGCECVCVGGWTGEACETAPRGWSSLSDETPKLAIPRADEPLPPLEESAPGCKAAAKAYYLDRYKSEEFRTDRALKFFWFLARNSLTPQCSSDDEQVVVVDIGANVGEQLHDWEREFLNLTHCKRDDTLLLLVEPNPQNAAVLRHRVARWEAANAGRALSGRIVVRDSAVSYYDGIGRFLVNKKQNRNSNMGNERGSLNVKDAGSDPSAVLVTTKVERLGSMIAGLGDDLLRRDSNMTITLLKVDAEGYDPAILYGAADLLPRTNVVVFECHKLWRNAGFTFKDVAAYFAKMGFRTYKMGMFYWIPVTPPAYWDDVYDETLQWSNCLAVRNGHAFGHMFSLPPPCK